MPKPLTSLERRLEDLYHNYILEAGKVRTGTMLKSVKAKINMNKDNYTYDLKAIYYFEYVDNGTRKMDPPFPNESGELKTITGQVENDPEFEKINDEVLTIWLDEYILK